MRHCIFVIGTRAQLVKVAPVLRSATSSDLPHTVWMAGQHSDSVDELIEDFQLDSRIEMSGFPEERSSIGKLLMWLPGALLNCSKYVRSVAAQEKQSPLIIVHGDTLSTFLGALAGKLAGADVVHLESGLSSKALFDPFPEELLRRLTFRLTRYALCPNPDASARMRQFRNCEVVDTGENTLLDCVRFAVAKKANLVEATTGSYFVASIHRFENIYRRSTLARILDEILAVADLGKVHFVLHPPTERQLRKSGLLALIDSAPGIRLEPRMPFTRFLGLLAGARGVFSDGGSNQEELTYLGVPTVLFRERSERPDGLGTNIVLRRDIGERLSSFVESGKLDELRQPRRLNESVQPSRTSVQALLRWSAGNAFCN
jgi:UDP-N-acetylglucosamine 2-epimerase (non-hydrolysing)